MSSGENSCGGSLTDEHLRLTISAKIFEQRNETSTACVRNQHLEVGEKEFLCILGPSGCGKTTLLRIIAGLETATTGKSSSMEKIVSGPTPKMAMIFQDYSLFPWRTVIENIAFGLEMTGCDREKRRSWLRSTILT